MIVVSDNSPLSALAVIGHFALLHQLYGRVIVPTAVAAEFLRYPAPPAERAGLLALPWVETRDPQDPATLARVPPGLGPGETAALALMLELGGDLLLIDEVRGRSAAIRLGLGITGVAGILVEAKSRGLLPAVGPLLQTLRQHHRFSMSEALFRLILAQTGE